MASRQPRPPWFRFSSLAPRAAAPPPPPPFAPSAPAPPVVRPTLPVRPPPPVAPPAPAPAPVRPPPQQRVASPPPPPAAPPPPPPSPPTSPVGVPARQPSPPRAQAVAPPRSPVPQPAQPSPPRPQAAAPPSSPVASAAAAPRSPVPQPARPSPPPVQPPVIKSPLTQPAQPSPQPVPPPATKSPLTSPFVKQALPTTTHAPPSSPITKSPAPSPPTRTSPIPTKAATPIPSPQTIKPFERTQSESPNLKPLSRPPSPFTLPPAQIKPDAEPEPIIEQKNVVVQQATGANHNNSIPSNGKREPMSKAKGTSKKHSEELDLSAITLAGENKGAVMELSPSRKKYYTVGNPQTSGYQSNSESGEERKSRNKEKANGGMTTQSSTMSYFNSNVQGLNNSIAFNTSLKHKDPGIHLSLRKANGDPDKDNYHHHHHG